MTLERAVSRNGLAQRAKSPISLALRAIDIFGKRLHRVASKNEEAVTASLENDAVDSLREDMRGAGQRIFCQLSSHD